MHKGVILYNIISSLLFFILSALFFSYSEKALEQKKNKLLCIVSTIVNMAGIYIANDFLFEVIIIFPLLMLLLLIELKLIFKAHIRQCIFLASAFFAHIATFYLAVFAAYSFILRTSPLTIRDCPNHKQILFSLVFLVTILSIIFNWRRFGTKKVSRVAKEPKFSEMVSAIAIFMVLYTAFDTLILFSETICTYKLVIALSSFFLNVLLYYELFGFVVNFVETNMYKRKTDDLKNEYQEILEIKETLLNKVNCAPLTNLYTRDFIYELLEDWSNNYSEPFAVFFADINGLKKVNDTFGHNVGDEYIINTSKEIQKSFRANDYIARIGGDEILILCKYINDTEANAILTRLNKNMDLLMKQEERYASSVSIGYILVTEEIARKGISYIVEQADIRMCDNKKCFYRKGGGVS